MSKYGYYEGMSSSVLYRTLRAKGGKKNKKRGNVNKGRQTCKRSGKCKAKKRRKDKKLFAFYTDNKICINLRAKDLSRK